MSKTPDQDVSTLSLPQPQLSNRRTFLKKASLAGATGAFAFAGLVDIASGAPASTKAHDHDDDSDDLRHEDREILIAAEIAEALAVTT